MIQKITIEAMKKKQLYLQILNYSLSYYSFLIKNDEYNNNINLNSNILNLSDLYDKLLSK